jgi:uncharacterized protein with PIN domain
MSFAEHGVGSVLPGAVLFGLEEEGLKCSVCGKSLQDTTDTGDVVVEKHYILKDGSVRCPDCYAPWIRLDQ